MAKNRIRSNYAAVQNARQHRIQTASKSGTLKFFKPYTMKMSRLLFIALLGTLALASCKRDNQRGGGPQDPQGTTVGTASPPLTQANTRETQLLTKNFWVVEFFVIPGNEGQLIPARHNKGLWWQFNMDGTYVGGQWQEQNDHGTWFWKPGAGQYEKSGMLFIDSAVDDMRDSEFQMQGIERTGDVMSWVKTANFGNREAGMLKVIQMLSMPTKAQFGVE